jgi:hypothetical protein
MESAENGIVMYGNVRVEYIRVIPLMELPVSKEPRQKSVAGDKVPN